MPVKSGVAVWDAEHTSLKLFVVHVHSPSVRWDFSITTKVVPERE
jgi:hypothetical protein